MGLVRNLAGFLSCKSRTGHARLSIDALLASTGGIELRLTAAAVLIGNFLCDCPGRSRSSCLVDPALLTQRVSKKADPMAALAHLTAMDGGNAIGLQEQSLPCAMAGLP